MKYLQNLLLFAKRHKRLTGFSLILFCFFIYIVTGFINPLTVTKYSYTSAKIPADFEGYKIVHISDFHCKSFGNKESRLIKSIREQQPDLIVFTGDSVDDEHTIANYRYLIEGIHDLAPIYFINGNHEYDILAPITEMNELHDEFGIVDLNDSSAVITKGDSSILLTGLDFRKSMKGLQSNIEYANTSIFNILLYHGTDRFDGIAPYNYDLVLSGHTHGGLVCLPFIGGIITNQKELFPKYDSGIFTVGASTMISSRGLGDATVPRFHNPREVICITLHTSAVSN